MTAIAAWILALATLVIAGTGVGAWQYVKVRPGRTRRELAELRDQVELLQYAVWMVASNADRERIHAMLRLRGWQPDEASALLEKVGYYGFKH